MPLRMAASIFLGVVTAVTLHQAIVSLCTPSDTVMACEDGKEEDKENQRPRSSVTITWVPPHDAQSRELERLVEEQKRTPWWNKVEVWEDSDTV